MLSSQQLARDSRSGIDNPGRFGTGGAHHKSPFSWVKKLMVGPSGLSHTSYRQSFDASRRGRRSSGVPTGSVASNARRKKAHDAAEVTVSSVPENSLDDVARTPRDYEPSISSVLGVFEIPHTPLGSVTWAPEPENPARWEREGKESESCSSGSEATSIAGSGMGSSGAEEPAELEETEEPKEPKEPTELTEPTELSEVDAASYFSAKSVRSRATPLETKSVSSGGRDGDVWSFGDSLEPSNGPTGPPSRSGVSSGPLPRSVSRSSVTSGQTSASYSTKSLSVMSANSMDEMVSATTTVVSSLWTTPHYHAVQGGFGGLTGGNGSSSGTGGANGENDYASIITLASSSRRRRRRSIDTNASTMGIAPSSIRSFSESVESLP